MMKYIVDTNVLMSETKPEGFEKVYIPIAVLEELDKHNHFGSPEKAYFAREAMRWIDRNSDNIETVFECREFPNEWLNSGVIDNMILGCARSVQDKDCDAVFVTADLNLYQKAYALGMRVEKYVKKNPEVYKGYKEVMMTDVEYCDFCTNFSNEFGLLENEYLIIYKPDGEVLDRYRWTKDGFKVVNTRAFKSKYFDTTRPLDTDPTQALAFDSLYSTPITVLFGRAGCGKTHIALSYLMSQLQNNKINKLYIVHSFETLKDSKTLGFLPGTKDEKIFGSGIGTVLSTKFGSIEQTVKPLIQSGMLEIVPTAEIRGVEFGEKDAMFITEAQNISPYAMKTAIQRCKEGCKIIIEGDMLEQTDIRSPINGMERLIEVFKGQESFSCVKLQKNNRNPIGELADKI